MTAKPKENGLYESLFVEYPSQHLAASEIQQCKTKKPKFLFNLTTKLLEESQLNTF